MWRRISSGTRVLVAGVPDPVVGYTVTASSSSASFSRLRLIKITKHQEKQDAFWGREDVWLKGQNVHIHVQCRAEPKLHVFTTRKQTAGFYN